MIVYVDGIEYKYDSDVTYYDILKDIKKEYYINYYGVMSENNVNGLIMPAKDGEHIKFLGINDREGMRIYQTTLRFIMSYAINKIYPGLRVIYNYSVSRAIFCQIVGNIKVSSEVIEKIQNEMIKIINEDIPITFVKVKKEKLIDIYLKQGYKSKVDIIRAIKDIDEIHAMKAKNFYNFFDSWVCPSTGFAKNFKLLLYSPGIILQYPRAELNGEIPEFQDEQVLSRYLKEQNKWGQITNASYILDYNKMIRNGKGNELITLCETRHNIMLAELGEKIEKDINNIRLICVSGPSSSGKTTFTNKLRMQLLARGIKPLMISLDNYYRADKKFPLNPDGTPDYEHVEALDLDLFNDNMLSLINGEEVSLPEFDFKTQKVKFGKPIKLSKNQPIMIEGIHGLNERLTKSIPVGNKFRIYIAPQAQFHIDSQNPFSITDIRLLRRIVRDYRDRGTDPKKTIQMWDSVRRGEFRWFYPYQEIADYVFNSELTYELGVLRKPALDALDLIKENDPEFFIANRLKVIISYFEDIDPKWIPVDSLIREFIGGSVFYEK